MPRTKVMELIARHIEEERLDASITLMDTPRPLSPVRPLEGTLRESDHWLNRFYGDGRMVREKKPGVFDHLRSIGAWFVSVDAPPLSVLDGMSQTATLCAGFAADEVVRHYVEGGFGDSILFAEDPSAVPHPAVERFAGTLRSLVPGLPHVTFTNSGAESVEKALALCRLDQGSPTARKVLAFEGSFHGRTLLSLHASYNPKKRAPFEISGYEVTFAPFPARIDPGLGEPAEPADWITRAAFGAFEDLESTDPLLAAELVSLDAVKNELESRAYFAVIVEPMQSEGGDRYATARFFRALRLLTRRYDVPLIIDEVQTGFGLSGTFAWHHRLEMVDAEERPDGPDYVTFAKRAQVGVVMSRRPDPEPTSSHPLSLIRGNLHAAMMVDDDRAATIADWVATRLSTVAAEFPDLVSSPRIQGYAFAFDLPSEAHLLAYLGQRFWRGAIVFGAGDRTVRYRLSRAYEEREIDLLFEAIQGSLEWMQAYPGEKVPAWLDVPIGHRTADARSSDREIRVRRAGREERDALLPAIVGLEARVYEEARRDPPDKLAAAFDEPDGVVVVAEARDPKNDEWSLVGAALGVPLESVASVPGPDRDPMLGRENTLYSQAVTVDASLRGLGVGRRLKVEQLRTASGILRNGRPRYRHVSGRNRVGATEAMMHVNRSLGAYEVCRLTKQYGGDGEASYYRMPVGAFVVDSESAPQRRVDFAQGISKPFAEAPATLAQLYREGQLYGPAVSKLTICNYITKAIARSVEHVAALCPPLPHLYLTSSRDEAFDKSVRILQLGRPKSSVAIGLEGGYVGHTSAAARSLSDPAVHNQGAPYFDQWLRVPHPDEGDTIASFRKAIDHMGGPTEVIGIFVEPIQERTGRTLSTAFYTELDALRTELDLPLVFVETAGAYYRTGLGAFAASHVQVDPDVRIWWAGGQAGFVHVKPKWFVDTPLTFVSTWDGDEISLIRASHQLRAAMEVDVEKASIALERALTPLTDVGAEVRGQGLYRVVDAGARTPALYGALDRHGLPVRRFANDCFAVIPTLDVREDELDALRAALLDGLRS